MGNARVEITGESENNGIGEIIEHEFTDFGRANVINFLPVRKLDSCLM